jgi:LysM repeat protein
VSDSEGAIARFDAIKGVTGKGVLDEPLRLPAVLNTITVSEEAAHTEYDTVSAGQFSMPSQGGASARKLRGLDLETLTVSYPARFLVERNLDADDVRDRLFAILRSKKPVMLTLVVRWGEPKPLVRMSITFRSISEELRPGESDTRYFTITIKEWRDTSVDRKSSKASRKPGVTLPTTHKLSATDTLESLAFEYYGSYGDWRAIRDANGISKRFGQAVALVKLGRYKVGSTVKVPRLGVSVGAAGGVSAP